MVRWAICGSGNMAGLFVSDSQHKSNGEFIAVYSHDQQRADDFAERFDIAHTYCDLPSMLANPDIDAVYIASTHLHHAPQAMAALNAGKHVLIEKPMALSEQEARDVFALAQQKNLFCCEAVWTKFSPCYQSLKQQLADGKIGQVQHLQANFGFAFDQSNTQHRLLNPQLAGGALLDIGLYPLLFALELLGKPDDIQAHVQMNSEGVDIASDLILQYQDGKSATISYRLNAHMPIKAQISGTQGWLETDSPFFATNALHWGIAGKPVKTEYYPMDNRGWGEEFYCVNEAISKGLTEAPEHSAADSLALAALLDRIRQQWGPIYPFEKM